MRNLTLENIAKACGGKLCGKDTGAKATCVVIDSRKMESGGVFIATKGERVDGHSFIPGMEEAGAIGVVCENVHVRRTAGI